MMRITFSACVFLAATAVAGILVANHPTHRTSQLVRPSLKQGPNVGAAPARPLLAVQPRAEDAGQPKAVATPRPSPALPLTVASATLVGRQGPVAHASHLAAMPGAGVQVVWFSGSREGASDVQILRSQSSSGGWSSPIALLSRAQLAASTGKHIRKLGNPVLHVDAAGGVHLFVVSVSLGGWAGARIEHLRSNDSGTTWSRPRSLVLSPFINISTLARAPAVNTADGGFVLPVYHEFVRKASELLVFDAAGELVTRHRLMAGVETLQPALVALAAPAQTGRMYMRNDIAGSKQMLWAPIDDRIQPGEAMPTNLPNRDSGLAAAALPNGLTVVAYNPADRSRLMLAVSADGVNFRDVALVASGEGKEYSYPSLLLQGEDLWLSYTRERRDIAITPIPWRDLASAMAMPQSGLAAAVPASSPGSSTASNIRP